VINAVIQYAELDGPTSDRCPLPDRPWATSRWVSILLATRELQGWLADSRPYDGQHKRGWFSAINDFERSAGHLGPDLRTALSQELVDAAAAASRLKTDFGSITSASAMRTRLAERRVADRQALGDLSVRWAAADILAAAWRDLLEACRTAAVSYEMLATRRDLVWQLVRGGGHDADQMSRNLTGVLGDTAFEVALVRLWLGDIGESGIPRPLPAQGPALPSRSSWRCASGSWPDRQPGGATSSGSRSTMQAPAA
jgi:hypothetical protein